MTFQEIILALRRYWAKQGCLLLEPYDLEKGAGTFHPGTFFGVLGPKPHCVAYVEPSRRPNDGRYGENPNRLSRYYQYQVILKPSPKDAQGVYLRSLKALGLSPQNHDIRFMEDDWESPTLGASGLGWEVWLDGMEITQFTYFQQMGGIELHPVSLELTYGLERIAMYTQKKDSVFDIQWDEDSTYGQVHREGERQFSFYHFEEADVEMLRRHFSDWENEAKRLLQKKLYLPAYDAAMKCSHLFNILEARGSISVTERTERIARMRRLTQAIAEQHMKAIGASPCQSKEVVG